MSKLVGFVVCALVVVLLLWSVVYGALVNRLWPWEVWSLWNFPLPLGWTLLGVFVGGLVSMMLDD